MDATVVRILWLILTFGLPPAGVIGYIAAWIIMPEEPVQVAYHSSNEPAPSGSPS
jgi:phage shock protein PspC (stress-responsive transcriptional regulator)